VSDAPRRLARVAVAVIVVGVAANVVASATNANATQNAGDVAVTAKNTKFGPNTVTVPSGRVSFFLDNKDFQLHNFHIDGAGSAVLLDARHSVRHVFDLQPGTYRFECDFHDGMTGTLTVTR
jgi:plastocyanin